MNEFQVMKQAGHSNFSTTHRFYLSYLMSMSMSVPCSVLKQMGPCRLQLILEDDNILDDAAGQIVIEG